MTQDMLLLIGVTILGVYAIGWTRRLAPPWSELPLKTTLATVAAGLLVFLDVGGSAIDPTLRAIVVVLAPVFVAAPLAITAAARARRYAISDALTTALYWTEAGRDAVRRLTVQVALQQGDADAALARLPERESEAMRAQALAARGDWEAVLGVEVPEVGDGAFLGSLARVEALLALGRIREADAELHTMQARWEGGPKGPIGYRSLALAEARIDAERGNLRSVQSALGERLPGVAPDLLFAIVARAADVAGESETAARLYGEAYRHAPVGRRSRYEAGARATGEELPTPVRRGLGGVVTLSMGGVLALFYVAQMLIDANLGPFLVGPFGVSASNLASAFTLGLPVPDGSAWWRHLSYAFVHAGIVHVGFNLWVLLDIGRLYETRRGGGNLLAAFAVGTAMGAYLTGLAQAGDTVILVGASGGVLGVAGALLADVVRSENANDRALVRGLAQWMVLIALLSVAIPNVSLWGHAGGVVGGLLWGFARQGLPAGAGLDRVAGAVAVVALALAFAQVARVVIALT